jgi:hypothetical protein
LAGIGGGIKRCILFDDETRNIRDIEKEGGVGVLLDNGLTESEFQKGLELIKAKCK